MREARVDTPVRSIGVPQRFLAHASRSEIHAHLGLTADDLVASISSWVERPADADWAEANTMHSKASAAGRGAMPTHAGPPVKRVLLAQPRGYCAGVDRAVETVERALERHGAPVYVRNEIVHNRHVVATLRERGVVFVNDTDKVPPVR